MARIGLDLLSLHGEWTGMAWQAWWLAHHLPTLGTEHTFVFFLPPATSSPSEAANVEIVRLPSGGYRGARIVGEQWHLARAAGRAHLDLLHTIAYGPPWLYHGRKILTVHDFALWVMPEIAPPRWRHYWQWAWGIAGRECRLLIAVSDCTKHDAMRFLKRSEDSIRVVPCGVDTIFTPAPPGHDPMTTIRRLGLPESYILNVGTIQPRKDLGTLLDCFARLRLQHADLHLVIVGGRGWGYDDIATRLLDLGLTEVVHLTGFINREALPDLYRAAKLFLFTSRYEGFGLPLLEAMASGTPVVTTRHSAIPEVVGKAALTALPGDAGGLAESAGRLLTDQGLRDRMVKDGLGRAAEFSWESAARRTLEVYREALASE